MKQWLATCCLLKDDSHHERMKSHTLVLLIVFYLIDECGLPNLLLKYPDRYKCLTVSRAEALSKIQEPVWKPPTCLGWLVISLFDFIGNRALGRQLFIGRKKSHKYQGDGFFYVYEPFPDTNMSTKANSAYNMKSEKVCADVVAAARSVHAQLLRNFDVAVLQRKPIIAKGHVKAQASNGDDDDEVVDIIVFLDINFSMVALMFVLIA